MLTQLHKEKLIASPPTDETFAKALPVAWLYLLPCVWNNNGRHARLQGLLWVAAHRITDMVRHVMPQ